MDDSYKKSLERRLTDIAKRNTRIEDYAGVGASYATVDDEVSVAGANFVYYDEATKFTADECAAMGERLPEVPKEDPRISGFSTYALVGEPGKSEEAHRKLMEEHLKKKASYITVDEGNILSSSDLDDARQQLIRLGVSPREATQLVDACANGSTIPVSRTPLHGGLPGAAAVMDRANAATDSSFAKAVEGTWLDTPNAANPVAERYTARRAEERADFDRRARYAYAAAMERLQTEIGPEDVGKPPETMTPVMEDQYEPGAGQVTGVITAQVVYVEAARSRMDREVDAITEKAVEIVKSMESNDD